MYLVSLFKKSLVPFTLLALTPLFTACGQYAEVHEKHYKIFFNTQNAAILSEADRLITNFNDNVGFYALEKVGTIGDANSTVQFPKGLRENEGKLGYGQWRVERGHNHAIHRALNKDVTHKVEYSMGLEFDFDFVKSRAGKDFDDPEYIRLVALFNHEVGHGMQMDHSSDPQSIMYPSIHSSANVESYDFEAFYERVRGFLTLENE